MTDEEVNENSSIYSERHYMRLSNLPWTASQQDIQQFFKDIQIPEGGVSIYKRDVFIAFLSNSDLDEAMKRNGQRLHGARIYLSTLERSDFYRLRHRNVRRVLNFPRTIRGGFTLRRIRPTFKAFDDKDMFSVFNPKECDFKCVIARDIIEESTVKRKIKPTQVDAFSKFDGYHFEDRYSFEASHCSKKMKLDEKFLELPPLCKT